MGFTKADLYHIMIGLIATAVWLFGKKADLPPEAVSFASALVIAVCAHAVGTASANNGITVSEPEVLAVPVTQAVPVETFPTK